MRIRYTLCFSFLFLTALCSTSVAKPHVDWTVDLRSPASQKVHVIARPTGLGGLHTVLYQMPVWAPGAYSVTHYGNYVVNLTAKATDGSSIAVERLNADKWELQQASKLASIEYDVLDSHADSTSLYFGMANIDSMIVFANATCFFGYFDDHKDVSATVTYLKPETWELATALDPIKVKGVTEQAGDYRHTTFTAKDYDELVDAPMMAAPHFQATRFTEGPATYDLVMLSNKPLPLDSTEYYTRKIVKTETEFFHDVPFKHYTFLIYAPTFMHMPSQAQGALEHANSSDYLLMNMSWLGFKHETLPVISHEFFHLWNVKRIHSSLLGPFDYTQRVKTTSLWLSEGITDYYAHTLLTRGNIWSVNNFYGDLETWQEALEQHAASKTRSLEDLSIDESDFHLDDAELFYIKGPLVGLMLDIEIRKQTANKKSLDDVMLALNRDAKKHKTFTDAELIHKVEAYSGANLADFYHRYIAGTDSLPIDSYLHDIGLLKSPPVADSNKLRIAPGHHAGWIVTGIDTGSVLGQVGVKRGDEIVTVNGKPVGNNFLDAFAEASVKIEVIRDNQPVTINGDLVQARARAVKYQHQPYYIDPNATPLANAMREGILNGKF